MVVAHALLRRAEAAVVGGGGLQHARLQAAPQLLLVLPGTERRAHHMGGSVVPVGMPVDLVVHQQMAGQHLAEHALTLVRSEEHTSELQSLMRSSYAVFCLKKKNPMHNTHYKNKKTNQHN